jgi:hypothetical protein
MPEADPTAREVRAARVAHVLARAVRHAEVDAIDALRILKHELRQMNTNKKDKLPTRSRGAEEVIARYRARGEPVPKNSSDDALHADHVYPLTADALREITSLPGWLAELKRVAMVVCLTAKENYELEKIERRGTTGPAKYAEAGIDFMTEDLPWLQT